MNFGKQMREYRRKNNWTLYEMGSSLGISHTYLHDIETGRKPPTLVIAERFQMMTGHDISTETMVVIAMKPNAVHKALDMFPEIKTSLENALREYYSK